MVVLVKFVCLFFLKGKKNFRYVKIFFGKLIVGKEVGVGVIIVFEFMSLLLK